jgi:hypothetical protein
MATVHVAEQCLIPGDVATLAAFRRWAVSDEFPRTGRTGLQNSRAPLTSWSRSSATPR